MCKSLYSHDGTANAPIPSMWHVLMKPPPSRSDIAMISRIRHSIMMREPGAEAVLTAEERGFVRRHEKLCERDQVMSTVMPQSLPSQAVAEACESTPHPIMHKTRTFHHVKASLRRFVR